MFLKIQPIGTNVPSDEDRIPIWKVTSGDDWSLTVRLAVPGHPKLPATPDNSKVAFALAEDRFSSTPIWTARWDDGILPVDTSIGLAVIRIPDTVTTSLRRGAYSFSITVSDHFGRNTTTVLTGTMQVEYEPTSPQHDIPYRSDI